MDKQILLLTVWLIGDFFPIVQGPSGETLVGNLEGTSHGKSEERGCHCVPVPLGRWREFQTMVLARREAVDSALRVHNYCVDCEETSKWIIDKTKVVESTKDLGQDLAGVMAIQRKLSGLERDVAAIQVRVGALEQESHKLMESHREQEKDIGERQAYVEELWQGLQQALKGQEALLGKSSQLQAFLQDLDAFEAWLSTAQKEVASKDMPESLPEAEQLLQQHAALKDDIDRHQENYQHVKASGEKVIHGQTDPEYLLLGQRLEGLDKGWDALCRMWESRGHTLAQCLGFQEFQKDAKQAEAILSNQVGRGIQDAGGVGGSAVGAQGVSLGATGNL